jgi:hypothetical protein
MKITAIRATPVNIPLEAPYLWSYGALAGFSKTIVEVETYTAYREETVTESSSAGFSMSLDGGVGGTIY